MSRATIRKPTFLALSCVGAFAAMPALATDLPNAAPAVDGDQDDRDILVDGQRQRSDPKQVARLLDTPISIVVLNKDTIEQTGSNSLQDALRLVPGITFAAAEGGNPIGDRPFIRGFDAQGSIFVDGVRDLASQSREVFAVDSVQIVRGSDSTLGGRGSAGGTINIRSKLPQNHTFGSVSASYGNGDYKRATADLNLKISDTAAFRIEGMYHDQSVVGRDAIWNNRWGVAPSFTLGLGTPTRMTFSFYHMESHELPDSGLPFLNVCSATNCALPAGNFFSTPALGNVTTRGGQTGYVSRSTFYGLADRDFRDTKTNQATLRVEHDFGNNLTLRNTARFNRDTQAYIYTQPDDSQGNVFGTTATPPAAGSAAAIRGDRTTGGYVWRRANTRYGYTEALIDQTDLSGTFNTGSIKHSFAAGTEFSWEKTRRGAFVLASGSTVSPRCNTSTISRNYCTSLFNPNPNGTWVNYASDTSNVQTPIVKGAPNTETQNDASTVAFYGFDSITIIPQLILNVGARYDRFKSTVTPPFTAGGTAVQLSRTDELFNWQAGAVFKPTKETSVYFSYATAATPPNSLLGEGREDNALPTTSTAANLALLDQLKVQKTKSYEVGAKASVFHEKLALAAAAFQTEIQNARVTSDAGTVAFIGNTRIRGFELTANGQITPEWSVFGGYTYLDPKVIDGGLTALTVAANGAAAATTVYVASVNNGKQVPQIAKQSFTATTNYAFAKSTFLSGLQIGGSAIYSSRVYGGYADNRSASQTNTGVVTVTPATVQFSRGIPSYWRFDARASYELTRNLNLAVNVQNLTDKAYFSQTFTTHYATIAPGRTVFGTLTAKF